MRPIEIEKINRAYKFAKDEKMQMLNDEDYYKYALYQGMTITLKLIMDYMNEQHNELSIILDNETV